jgi:hypothetical protein
MGQTGSKPEGAAVNAGIDQAKAGVDTLRTLFQKLSENDMPAMLDVAKKVTTDLQTGNNRTFKFANVSSYYGTFKAEMEAYATKNNKSIDNVTKYVRDELGQPGNALALVEAAVASQNAAASENLIRVFGNDPTTKTTVKTLLDGITNLKARQTYFQYRYVQLNVFLLAFIENAFGAMSKFIDAATEAATKRDNECVANTKKLTQTLIDMLQASGPGSVSKEDIEMLDTLMAALASSAQDKRDRLEQALTRAGQQAMAQTAQPLQGTVGDLLGGPLPNHPGTSTDPFARK